MAVVKKVNFSPKKVKRSALKLDRWVNPSSDFGGASDPMMRTYFGRDFTITQSELDNLYEGDWVARRAIDIHAKDATREWVQLTHDDDLDKAQKVTDDLVRLDVQSKFKEAIILARLYGGCAMILGAFDGQEVDQPLGTIERIEWIENVDRFHAYPSTWYQDPLDPRFGTPETYTIQRLSVVGSFTAQVHESRIVRFDGNYLPPRLRIRNFGWSAPVFQSIREALRQFGVSTQSGASVLQDFITLKVQINNLTELLRSDDGEEELVNRLSVMAQERSTHNLAVYGADETIEKMGTPITGLTDLIDLYLDVMSAAAEVPKSRFFHNETGRLGGDGGEQDKITHYDNIAAFQKNDLSAPLQKIINIVAEPLGFEEGVIKHTWNSLWQLSDEEKAKQYLDVAQADNVYIQAGVLEPEEVAINRFGGDGLNLNDMTIETGRRQKLLDEIEKQPIDLDEGDDDLDDEGNPKVSEEEEIEPEKKDDE